MIGTLDILAPGRRLKQTTSRCPECLAPIEAEVLERDGQVVMVKACADHGRFEVVLARDPRFYHLSRGASANAACCAGTECAPAPSAEGGPRDRFETLSTCVALIEIVDSCNLTCPTCYAASPWGVGEEIDAISFAAFTARVGGVIERKGFIDILQLTGGEPTIHPEFFRFLEWALARDEIGYVLINTNAVRIAADEAFRRRLGALRETRGGFELYVQFDGVQADGQRELRGADLRDVRRQAIDEAGALGVPSTLAMVVTPETQPFIGDAMRFGLARPHCRGITFQPMFNSGRVPRIDSTLPVMRDQPRPISVGDVILDLVDQSQGVLSIEDFTPLPCGDPNCHTIGYLLRSADGRDGPVGLSRLLDLPSLQGFLTDRLDYDLADLARCGCETEPLGSLLHDLEIGPERPFRIFIKPFMDAWNFDEDRIDRCCTHVIRPDGALDSFCRYYLAGGAGGGDVPRRGA